METRKPSEGKRGSEDEPLREDEVGIEDSLADGEVDPADELAEGDED